MGCSQPAPSTDCLWIPVPLNDLLAGEPERAVVPDPEPAWYLLAFPPNCVNLKARLTDLIDDIRRLVSLVN
jgi:hypothetical protein